MAESPTVSQHFEGKDPIVKTIDARIVAEARKFGPVGEKTKKTSFHLANRSACAGVVTRKSALILNIKSAEPIRNKRFRISERVSASRYHQELQWRAPDEVDAPLIKWLKEAHALSG